MRYMSAAGYVAAHGQLLGSVQGNQKITFAVGLNAKNWARLGEILQHFQRHSDLNPCSSARGRNLDSVERLFSLCVGCH